MSVDSKQGLIGPNIKFLRNRILMTKEELAKNLNIGRERLDKWENGINEPPIKYIIILADFFNVKIDDLLKINIESKLNG